MTFMGNLWTKKIINKNLTHSNVPTELRLSKKIYYEFFFCDLYFCFLDSGDINSRIEIGEQIMYIK